MNHKRLSDLADRFAGTVKNGSWRHAAKLGELLTNYAKAEVKDRDAEEAKHVAELALEQFIGEAPPE